MNKSVATINNPEFINLTPLELNPLMSKCDIKVLYLGKNRNRSFITKDVALDMAKTLRGCPIVGAYKEDKEDFSDHGARITIDDEGIKTECLTVPYGFVSTDAEVWFQEFEDEDEFGNHTVREYLMTNGYLWTGQFEEAQRIIDKGNNQSMELDEKTLQGKWAEDPKDNIDFFIINDAVFSKLCILGEDVEPCFEGASITASKQYTLEKDFSRTLYSMLEDMKQVLAYSKNDEGGLEMDKESTKDFEKEEVELDHEGKEEEEKEEEKEFSKEEDSAAEEFAEEEESEEEDASKEFQMEEEKIDAISAELEELRAFKLEIENEKKDALIDSFYMLNEEDKKEIRENKTEFSLDEIKAKLAVICFDKKIDLSEKEIDQKEDGNKDVMTYGLHSDEKHEDVPAFVGLLKASKNKRSL